jgi:hypothetical protein
MTWKHFLRVFICSKSEDFLTYTMIQNLIPTLKEFMIHRKYKNFHTLQIKNPKLVLFSHQFNYLITHACTYIYIYSNFVMLNSCIVSIDNEHIEDCTVIKVRT